MTRSDPYRVESFSPGHRPGARATGWLTSAVRRVRIAGLVFVLVGFFSLLTGVSPAYAGEDGLTWAVTHASGDVRHRTGGFFSTEWQKLQVGDVVGAAAEIRTGRNSRVVFRHRKTTITANSESRLALPGRSAFSSAYRVLQSLGTLLYNIKERADGMAAFEVETPYLVAVVKGTVFTVNVSADGASVQLHEGVVDVQATVGGTGATLAAGQTARVTRASSTDVIIEGRGADRRSGEGGQVPGASPEGGNPGGGGTGDGTDVGGSVGGGDPGGGHVARSDWSQDTARGADTGRGTTGTGSLTTIWSAPSMWMETAEAWMAGIWEGISEGMGTWVWVVWLLVWLRVIGAGVCVVWVAVSTLWISPEALRRLQEAESASRYDGGPMGRVQNAATAGGSPAPDRMGCETGTAAAQWRS